MTRRGEFHPIRYDVQRVALPGEITVRNHFSEQPLKFRMQVAPVLTVVGDQSNIPLLRMELPVKVQPPVVTAIMPGALVQRVEFTKAVQDQGSVFMVGPETADKKSPGKALDLTKHRALAVQLNVEGLTPDSGEWPVLNVQLEAGGGTYRDYYVDLNANGPRTVILPEPGTSRMLAEFRPVQANYPFKAAMYGFNYANVVAVNLRWMRYPKGRPVRCAISSVEALNEQNGALRGVEVSMGSLNIKIPQELKTGDYAEYWGTGTLRIFDRNGHLLSTSPVQSGPQLRTGENRLAVKALGSGDVLFTAITQGQ
jgi:hypothetical protein